MTSEVYVDIMNGTQYDLPGAEPTNGFREGVYDPDQATDTGTTSRIRALLYVWQNETLPTAPTIDGPFYNSGVDGKDLTLEQKNAMRSREDANENLIPGNILVLSDSGYAPTYDETGCSDNAGQIDPWATLEEVFTYDAGNGEQSFLTRSFVPTLANQDYRYTLDIWQTQISGDPTENQNSRSNVVICSDIFHIIAPTRYNQNLQAEPLDLSTLNSRFSNQDQYLQYSMVKTAFINLHNIINPGGVLIFSVPYDGNPEDTTGAPTELAPFPDTFGEDHQQMCYLWDWGFGEAGAEDVIENNPRGGGNLENVDNLLFTRSINCPPVLRRFSKGSIEQLLGFAGFIRITFHSITEDMNSFGIYWNATINTPSGLPPNWAGLNTPTNGTPESKSLIVTARRNTGNL